jgi:DNA-binding transcriptional LysR family regulator
MDWDNIRTFLAVARRNQFLAAGQLLRVNQATVARRVAALEAALDTTLFERSTTGVTLTDAGKRLLAHAERVESELLQAEADIRQQDLQLSGTVRIGAPDGFTTYFLVPALRSLAERHPGLVIELVPMPIAASLARREVDIAITIEEPDRARVVAQKLTDYSLGIFANKAYLKRKGRPKTIGDLSRHTLIGYVETYAFSSALDYVADLFGNHATKIQCASAVGQVEAVRHGLGLGVLHHFISTTLADIEPVLPERRATRGYWLAVHEDVQALGRIRAVSEHIVAETAAARHRFLVA